MSALPATTWSPERGVEYGHAHSDHIGSNVFVLRVIAGDEGITIGVPGFITPQMSRAWACESQRAALIRGFARILRDLADAGAEGLFSTGEFRVVLKGGR